MSYSRFVDVTLPPRIASFPVACVPRFSTQIVMTDSGAETVNVRWQHPLRKFTLPDAIREQDDFMVVYNHWLAMAGPTYLWAWRDPLDFASRALAYPTVVPTVADTDQELGVGDGLRTEFQITKLYTSGPRTYTRNIQLPVLDSFVLSFTGGGFGYVLPAYTVSRPGGIVTFAEPVANGVILRCGYLFDVPVRFESDESFESVTRNFSVSGYSELTLLEARLC